MKDDIITGIDIGSSAIRVAVGRINQDNQLQIIGAAEVPSDGVNKGVISSIEDAVSAIANCLEKTERMVGMPVEHAFVGISGSNIIAQESHGVVAVARSNGEIHEEDIERVIEAAQTVVLPPNYEILHVIPRGFLVDGQAGIKYPVGMTGIRLEVETQIIGGSASQVRNLTKSIYRTGVDIDDLVLSVLACAECVLDKKQKELGVAVVNIGASTTSLVVFEEGDVLHTAVIPVGASHITNDIAIGLRTNVDVAEKVKLEYGSAIPQAIDRKEEIDLGKFLKGEDERVKRRQVAEIVLSRLEEMFELIDKELIAIERSGMLPAGIVLTGGGAKLKGIIDVAKKEFRLPVALGSPHGLNTPIERVNELSFTTALGLVYWGSQLKNNNIGSSKSFNGIFQNIKSVIDKAGGILKNLKK